MIPAAAMTGATASTLDLSQAGHGDKGQIRAMVKCLLPRASFDSTDEADALAIAITHAHHRGAAALRMKVAGA